MPVSPPTKATMNFALILTLIGLVVGAVGAMKLLPVDLIPIGMDTNFLFYVAGFGIPAIGWFIMFLGTRMKGM